MGRSYCKLVDKGLYGHSYCELVDKGLYGRSYCKLVDKDYMVVAIANLLIRIIWS